jgi:hypothetical protein
MATANKAENQRRLWAENFAKADGPQAIAAVEFNRVRADILDLPARQRDRHWRELSGYLKDFHRKLVESTDGDVHDSLSRRG